MIPSRWGALMQRAALVLPPTTPVLEHLWPHVHASRWHPTALSLPAPRMPIFFSPPPTSQLPHNPCPADCLPLGPGEGYLVVRRRAAAAPSSHPGAALPPAPAAALAAPQLWTPADEQRYQQSIAQLARLVQLRASLWPRIQAWYRLRAALHASVLRASAAGSQAPLQLLLRWAVMQRLRQLQHMQQEWQQRQELEASSVLLQLSRGPARSQAAPAQPSNSRAAMLPPPPRPPRHLLHPHAQQAQRLPVAGVPHPPQPAAQHSLWQSAAPPTQPPARLQQMRQVMQLHCAPPTPRVLHADQQLVPPLAKRQRVVAASAGRCALNGSIMPHLE